MDRYCDYTLCDDEGYVQIKPLSVNQAYLGRKVKSGGYRKYERDVLELLPNDVYIPPKGMLELIILFGHSNSSFDYDNGIKPFQDILQKKYEFNDRRICMAVVGKIHVKKGEEFIFFKLRKFSGNVEDIINEHR